nr:hypothetical protein [Tanacetum cinerariifolium]
MLLTCLGYPYSAATQFKGVTDWYQEPSIPYEDPYEEAAQQLLEQAPHSPEYVPDPIELEDHVLVHIPKHPEDLVPAEDEAHIEAYIPEVASTPTPPLPPSFLSLRTPPLLPIPLPVPSTSHRAEIPKANMSPQKRLLLTAPRPGCEVWESSVAAAARQPGPTMARSVDCSFVDTIKTRFRDTKRRMMTVLETVNMRVSYQVDVRSRENSGFYSRHHDAQKDRAAVRAETEKMAPKRTTRSTQVPPVTPALTATTTTVTEAQLQVLIDRGVAATMAEAEASRVWNGYDINGSRPRLAQVVRECTYLDFLKCQPLKFKGTEGVVGLTQWFKKMESVFNISNYTLACQVKYAACTLQGVALTWWNSHVKTVTLEVAQALPWKTLKKMMTDKYCPRGEIKKLKTETWELKTKGTDVIGYSCHFQELALMVEKYISRLPDTIHDSVKATMPKKMHEAIEFATELMDKRIRDVVENRSLRVLLKTIKTSHNRIRGRTLVGPMPQAIVTEIYIQ